MNSYKELLVWQKSIEFVVEVYKITKDFPKQEIYGLASQMQRAVVSVPSNIAEGHERNSTKEYIQFLYISKGSLAELETQIIIAEKLAYLNQQQKEFMLDYCDQIGKMINGILKKLK